MSPHFLTCQEMNLCTAVSGKLCRLRKSVKKIAVLCHLLVARRQQLQKGWDLQESPENALASPRRSNESKRDASHEMHVLRVEGACV
jgi:hypothetical protein